MNIVLVHGFNVRDAGKRTIDTLAPGLISAGHTVDTDSADYGWHDLIRVRLFHRRAVNRIARAMVSADVCITHSNGANYAQKALKKVSGLKILIHLSPALNKKTRPPESVKTQHTFHTRHDSIVKLARYMLFHPWGSQGSIGYQGLDHRVNNHDYTNQVDGHSDWFKDNSPAFFADVIADILRSS